MVKVFGRTLRWPWIRESVKGIDYGTAKATFQKPSVSIYKPRDLQSNYDAYLDSDLIRAFIDDLAESACGGGYYTTAEKVTPVKQVSKSKDLCDHFGQHFNLDELLVNITKNVLIAGFLPVETDLVGEGTDGIEKSVLKIIHPLTIDPQKGVETDTQTGAVLRVHQKVNEKEATIERDKLAWFNYGQIGNDPRGTSLIRSIIPLLNTLNEATADVDAILDRYISPLGIWKSRRPIDEIKAQAVNRPPGEDIFLGKLSEDEMKEGVVEFISVDPRVPFWDYIQYLDQRVYAYSRASNLWYTRNATEASATIMENIIDRHIKSIQRTIKRGVEKYWFTKLVKLNELEEIPKLEFGVEKTGVEEIQIEPFLTKGLEIGYITQGQYTDLLQQLGLQLKEEKLEEEPPPGSALPPEEEGEPTSSTVEERQSESLDIEAKKAKLQVYKHLLEKMEGEKEK